MTTQTQSIQKYYDNAPHKLRQIDWASHKTGIDSWLAALGNKECAVHLDRVSKIDEVTEQ